MLNEFIKAKTDICINKKGVRAVSINDSDPANGNRLLNMDIDNIKNVFILSISDEEYHICKLEKDGYTILYKIKIDLQREMYDEHSNVDRYLLDIIDDGKEEIYSYIRGYLEGMIDAKIKFNKVEEFETSELFAHIKDNIAHLRMPDGTMMDIELEDNIQTEINDYINNGGEKSFSLRSLGKIEDNKVVSYKPIELVSINNTNIKELNRENLNEISVDFSAFPATGESIDKLAKETLEYLNSIIDDKRFAIPKQILLNKDYFKYKTKVDEIREKLDNFSEEYLNEWKENNFNKPFDIKITEMDDNVSDIRKFHKLWLDYIKDEETINIGTPPYVGLGTDLQLEYHNRFLNMQNDLSGLQKIEIPKFLQGAFIGDPNDLTNTNIPKASSDIFDNFVDFDFAGLYPTLIFGIQKERDTRPKRKWRTRSQLYNARYGALLDLRYYYEISHDNAKYKYSKRVWNRMKLSCKQYLSGKRKLKLPRRKKK